MACNLRLSIFLVIIVTICVVSSIPAPGRGQGKGRGNRHLRDQRRGRMVLRLTRNKSMKTTNIVEQECQTEEDQGKVFKDMCNWCMCSSRPGLAACTRMRCRARIFGQKICGNYSVGQSYHDGCNTCACTAVGPMCTYMACPDDIPRKPASSPRDNGDDEVSDDETNYEENSRQKRSTETEFEEQFELNDDSDDDEKAVEKRSVRTRPFKRCFPGDRWQNHCNHCWCTDVSQPMCTMMYCLDEPHHGYRERRSSPRRQESQQFDIVSRLELLAVCGVHDIGDSWFDGCNTCVCTQYGPACTLAMCYDEPTEYKQWL